ncbi:hypothetical protein D3C73_1487680 [compost metagenome]
MHSFKLPIPWKKRRKTRAVVVLLALVLAPVWEQEWLDRWGMCFSKIVLMVIILLVRLTQALEQERLDHRRYPRQLLITWL